MLERVLLFVVAFAMVIFPIGWSVQGLAPLVIGGLAVICIMCGRTGCRNVPVAAHFTISQGGVFMKSRGTRAVVTAALIIAVSMWVAASAGAHAQKLSFSIVTGGTGGVWYPLGGAIGGVIGKYVPNTEATSEATTAAIDNMKLLGAGKAGMAFAYDYPRRLGERRQGRRHLRASTTSGW